MQIRSSANLYGPRDTLFFYKNLFIRTLRLRLDQKFKNMYGMK